MVLVVLVLVLALALGGAGVAVHALWYVAAIVLIPWLLGFLIRPAASGCGRDRWYRW
jgi:predicted Na+-dependent transporter